jgi:hypothetical protein
MEGKSDDHTTRDRAYPLVVNMSLRTIRQHWVHSVKGATVKPPKMERTRWLALKSKNRFTSIGYTV